MEAATYHSFFTPALPKPAPAAIAQKEEDVRILEPGQPVDRELGGSQSHSYEVGLTDGQYVQVIVEQRGIDVTVKLLGPDGRQVSEVDDEVRVWGQEAVSQVAEVAGVYRLIVQARFAKASAGRYSVRVDELRAATDQDRSLQEAVRLDTEQRQLYRNGKHDEAILLAERELAIREREEGQAHPDVASTLLSLGLIYEAKGDYALSESLFQRALNTFEQTLGPDHPKFAGCLNSLAILYRTKGDFDKAEPVFKRALEIRLRVLGPEHPLVADAVTNLASLAYEKGDYPRAELLNENALEMRKKSLGPDDVTVAASSGNLAIIYGEKGDFDKAERMFQNALAIFEKTFGPEHPVVAQTLANLGNLSLDAHDYGKAEPTLQRALTIREKSLGPAHPAVATILMNLASVYDGLGDYAAAESLHRRALDIREKALAPEHPDVAYSLSSFARTLRHQGKYDEAEAMLQQALTIWQKVFGSDHPKFRDALDALAWVYAAKRDFANAVAFLSRSSDIGERHLALNLHTGSERQKLAYLAVLSPEADRTITLHTRGAPDDATAKSLAATAILQRKGRVLDAMSDSLVALRRRFDAQDQILLDGWNDSTTRLAKLVLGGPQGRSLVEHEEQIKALTEQKENLESEIGRRSAAFRAQAQPVTLAAVRDAIPENASLIEFASYRPFDVEAATEEKAYGAPHYVSYILRRTGEIQWKELGEAKPVDEAIAALRQALRDPKRRDVQSLARIVDEKLMKPLRPLLADTTHLLISPDGSINLIPFAALVDEQGRYLIERYSISYLSSGRDLLRLQVPWESQGAPLVVANPAFGAAESNGVGRPARSKPPGKRETRQSVTSGTDLSRVYFAPLGGTAAEASAIQTMFPEATVLSGTRATEDSLKHSVGPRFLHIATHGFFLEDQPVNEGSPSEARLRGLSANVKIENPLLRSGLALAAANLHLKEGGDGILTALEASGLNLWGTKLVVLSACDTAIGEIKVGDGVYGLRRAFLLAGAETEVMSLWPVSDYATRELMKGYYHGLKEGQGRGAALRDVQLAMLKQKDRQHPFYWASFIQSGEWANLAGNR